MLRAGSRRCDAFLASPAGMTLWGFGLPLERKRADHPDRPSPNSSCRGEPRSGSIDVEAQTGAELVHVLVADGQPGLIATDRHGIAGAAEVEITVADIDGGDV